MFHGLHIITSHFHSNVAQYAHDTKKWYNTITVKLILKEEKWNFDKHKQRT